MTNPAQAVSRDADAQLAEAAMALELAARDLYQGAIDAGATGELWATLRDQHESFGQRLAGLIGVSASTVDAELTGELEGDFAAADPAQAAVDLENRLAATHSAVLAEITGSRLAAAIASIVTSESRHAVVAGNLAGIDDPEALYVNPIVEAGA